MFNNETGKYDRCDWLMEADWFEDSDGYLFMVPKPDEVVEIEGPDGLLLDAMNAACRDHESLTDQDCERLGLRRIADILKRFDPMHGYYHA